MDLEIHNYQFRNEMNLTNINLENQENKINRYQSNLHDQTTNYEEYTHRNHFDNSNFNEIDITLHQVRRLDIIDITLDNFPNGHKNSMSSCSELNGCCKVCYEKGSKKKPVITPCLCEGSMKYIHEVCLKKWIKIHFSDIKKAYCEICKYKYRLKFYYSYNYECEITCTVFGFILSILFLVINTLFELNSMGRIRCIYILSFVGFLFLMMINFSFCFKCRKIYFQKTIKSWRVFNNESVSSKNLS